MSRKPLLIYVGYKKRSGKDTFVNMLTEQLNERGYSVDKGAFGDRIKEDAANILGTTVAVIETEKNDTSWFKLLRRNFLSSISKLLNTSIHIIDRKSLTGLGTVMREHDEKLYVNAVKRMYEESKADVFIITDFRFKHEYFAKGITIKIQRDEVVETHSEQHLSETELDTFAFDTVVDNNGTLNSLNYKVRNVAMHVSILIKT